MGAPAGAVPGSPTSGPGFRGRFQGAAQQAGKARGFAAHGGPQLALTLIVAILFARLLLTDHLAGVWKALWLAPKPLGHAGEDRIPGTFQRRKAGT